MTHLELLQQFIDELLTDYTDLFCVEIKIKPTNNIKVFLDGDQGITIDKCVRINRKLYKLIEEANIFPEGDFSLEVSSPGVDEPLKLVRQYKKNMGRDLELILVDDVKKEGTLIEVLENEIVIEFKVGKGKKAVITKENIVFNKIKKATVLINFKSKS
ncbi:MAG: ribosome maturation factor [Chitinophagaceae bacterium]|nr:ribosome maturation factor [Chitinophagaceae bacterium]